MKTFPAGFTAEKNKLTGARPLWIIKMTVGGVDYYLSDLALSIASWLGGITTKAWISSWGQVTEGISGELSEIRLSDLAIDCLIDPDSAPNMADLAVASDFERTAVSLYLWFRDLDPASDPPQEMARFFVRDPVEIPDETIVRIGLEDEAIRLQKYLGTKITRADFPTADPDDVGKVIPLVYGSVRRLPALAVASGIMTSLPSAINASTTSVIVSDATGLSAGMTLTVDDEEMTISAVSGDTLTVTRGVNTTLATIHTKGAIAWQVLGEYVYLLADHAVSSIPKVYGVVGAAEVEISAIASRYLGSGTSAVVAVGALGGQHPDYPGRACITLPSYITASQAVDLLVNDGIAVNDALSIVDSIAVNDTISVADTIGVSDTIGISNPTHGHTVSSTLVQFATGVPWTSASTGSYFSVAPTFGSLSGVSVATYTYTWGMSYTGSAPLVKIFDGSSEVSVGTGGSHVVTVSGTYVPEFRVTPASGGTAQLTINSASRQVVYDAGTTSVAQASSKSGSATKSGSASKSGSAAKSGSASRSGSVSKSGTVTISGNSGANTLVSDVVLVDVTGTLSTPAAVCADLLSRSGPYTLTQIGSFPASYRIDGAITDYQRGIDLLDSLAFQCRAYFRLRLGTGQLIVRPDTLTPVKAIPAIRLSGGRLTLSRRKAAMSEIINKINLLYDRDPSSAGSDDSAYRAALVDSDSQSITDYGENERPELFRFDLVRDATMAADLLSFYLGEYARRYWLHDFEIFLNHSELEFADPVTLDFLGGLVAEIQSAGFSPGDISRADVIRLTCRSQGAGDAAFAMKYLTDNAGGYILTTADGTVALTTRS
jgi:hypothetical protein